MSNETNNTNELIPEGWYSARAKSWYWSATKAGDPMLNVTYEITEGAYKVREVGGRLVFMVSTGQHMDKRATDLRTLGFEGEDSTEIQEPNIGGLDRNVVRVAIKHNEFNGAVYANVDAISATRSAAPAKPVDAGTMRRASDALKGALRAYDKSKGAPAAQGARPQTGTSIPRPQATARAVAPPPRVQPDYGPSAGDDSEIPF